MKNPSMLSICLLFALCACESEPASEGGGMTQVDPPTTNLNSGDNLPVMSDREDLGGTADPNVHVITLCLENQGFGDHYSFITSTCLGGTSVLRLLWFSEDGLGTVTDSEAFTIEQVSHGTLGPDGAADLPGYTELQLTGSGTTPITSITFTFDDGPSIRDVVVE